MRVLTGRNALARPLRRPVVTVGMFDGVHLGHQRLIQTTVRVARRLQGTSVVMTFDPDPQQVLNPHQAQPRLMPLEARVRLINTLGVDVVWIIPFTRQFSMISAEQFVRSVLLRRLRTSCIVVGENFAFGKARRGNLQLLRTLGRRHGMRVIVVPPVLRDGAPVSSSRIRRLIQQGDLAEARRFLGRPVELSGVVVRGEGRATHLGFPTANVRLVSELLPPRGVYRVWLDHAGRRFHGLMNLGVRPTFMTEADGSAPLVCEVHLVGFHATLYGRPVTVAVLKRLRAEKRFESPQDLVRQIRRDLHRARLVSRPS